MEIRVVGDRSKVIQELFSGFYSVNRKAKMVLDLLGFRSAAALPEHLHAAVLQVLLMGHAGPSCRRRVAPLVSTGATAQPLLLRSEGCVIQCLFADWLTKTSKWLKVPRSRYVMLLSVAPKPEPKEGQQLLIRSTISEPTESVGEEAPQAPGAPKEFEALERRNEQKPFPQLLLVTFKAPQEPFSTDDHESADSCAWYRAEPSEVFSIDSTHRALCQRVPCGKKTQLVLIVEGLGGRLLVLGEVSRAAASSSGTTRVQVSGLSPLEQLAHRINESAPLCAPPRTPRWRRLLQVFTATATAVDLGESMAIPAFGSNSVEQRRSVDGALLSDAQSSAVYWQVNCTASEEACYPATRAEEQPTISLVALLLRFSIAACFAICRQLTFAMRHCNIRSVVPRGSRAGRGTVETTDMLDGCNDCGSDPSSNYGLHCTRKGPLCGCARREQYARISSGQRTSSACVARPQRTLRQLIDDQQRSLAALAVGEYRRKVALVNHEYQMSRQQASRALMDEHGQLFPQARRWLDSTDGKLLMLCLTGSRWRPAPGPRT